MNLKDALKTDFGIEVLISKGIGAADDPFVIEPCSVLNAVRSQLNVLRGISRGRGELWRLLTAEDAHDVGPSIQRLRIETVLFKPDEIVTETRGYYFDIGHVNGIPNANAPFIEWADSRTRFQASFQICWWHFDSLIDNKPDQAALDVTLQYSTIGAKAAIYIYGQSDQFLQTDIAREFLSVCDQVRVLYPNAETPWPETEIGPFKMQHFLIGEDLSVAGVGVLGSHYLKLRLTYFDDLKMRELMNASIRELCQLALNS